MIIKIREHNGEFIISEPVLNDDLNITWEEACTIDKTKRKLHFDEMIYYIENQSLQGYSPNRELKKELSELKRAYKEIGNDLVLAQIRIGELTREVVELKNINKGGD